MTDPQFRRHNPNLTSNSHGSVGGWPLVTRDDPRDRAILDIEDVDRPIYRIFSRERFLQLLDTRSIGLVRTRMWEDPFENFLLHARARLSNGESVGLADLRDRYYGQCWTLNEESDAMWRIYSAEKATGIKVRSTPRRLFDAVYHTGVEAPQLAFFLGLVHYLPEKQIAQIMTQPDVARMLLLDSTGLNQVRTLLFKRYEFSHEAEVRMIFRENARDYDRAANVCSFSVDPSQLIQEVVLDPRATPEAIQDLTSEIRAHGFTGTIRQSALYRLPDFEIIIDDPGERQLGTRTWYEIRGDNLRLSDAR